MSHHHWQRREARSASGYFTVDYVLDHRGLRPPKRGRESASLVGTAALNCKRADPLGYIRRYAGSSRPLYLYIGELFDPDRRPPVPPANCRFPSEKQ
jgi:hypothetical protein